MVLVCGIDEAGKGPLFGDLVIAGCLIEEEKLVNLDNIGADSKILTRKKRELLFPKIKELVKDFHIVRVTAFEIDSRKKAGCNLNTLECIKMAQIINKLNPDKAIIDCPHPVPMKFINEIRHYLLNKEIIIVAEHKADYNYPLVGAASIIAKVTRDNHMDELSQKIGINLGSGYPSDPTTRKALTTYFEQDIKELKEYIRHSWSTYTKKKAEYSKKSLFDFQ